MMLQSAPLRCSRSAASSSYHVAVFFRHAAPRPSASAVRATRASSSTSTLCPRQSSLRTSQASHRAQSRAIASGNWFARPSQRWASSGALEQAEGVLLRGQEVLQEGANLPQPSGSISGPVTRAPAQTDGQPREEHPTSPAVAYWLLFSAASVFGIVVLGGLTRLTESG